MKKETKELDEVELVKRDENRPIAGQSMKPHDPETMSHQYQAGSPAVDTNVLSDHPNKDLNGSIVDKINKLNEPEQDPSTRDVYDPLYVQPDSAAHKSFLKRNK